VKAELLTGAPPHAENRLEMCSEPGKPSGAGKTCATLTNHARANRRAGSPGRLGRENEQQSGGLLCGGRAQIAGAGFSEVTAEARFGGQQLWREVEGSGW
jgi:hypothetical protein